jgi:hypothetical protein
LVQKIETLEIEIATVQDIKGPRLWDKLIEHIYIMHVSLCYTECPLFFSFARSKTFAFEAKSFSELRCMFQ